VPTDCTYLSYKDTHSFSSLVNDYLENEDQLKSFYAFQPNKKGVEAAINERKKIKTDRNTLVNILQQQYDHLPQQELVNHNIQQLLQENTFTICTAHQPNLLTGYLYFIYKIIHAIKLAEELNLQYPDQYFVPVYYMGSEDNDLDELGTFRYNNEKYVWDADGQTGAVGRMDTKSLKPLLDKLFNRFGPPGIHRDHLIELISQAYLQHKDIGTATQYLVHELFGRYGLIVLNPDDVGLKKQFIPIMQDDLLNHSALPIVQNQSDALSVHYKAQAYPRPINLFYLKGAIRERIEHHDNVWQVLHTEISWTKDELLQELQEHPEHFSPNVILRGLFQETILPNVAFIGGGSEVAYWMQLMPLFQHYHIFFPPVLLRQSVQWIDNQSYHTMQQLGFNEQQIFEDTTVLTQILVERNSNKDWTVNQEQKAFQELLTSLANKAKDIDPTLEYSASAVLTKINRQFEVLEHKMYRAEKRKSAIDIARIERLKQQLFPNAGLQERVENFMDYFLMNGPEFFDLLKDAIRPLDNQFLVIRTH
jgi:bacillithiol synthase